MSIFDRELDLLVAKHVFGVEDVVRTHAEMGLPVGGVAQRVDVYSCRRCGLEWHLRSSIPVVCSGRDPVPAYSSTGDGMLAVILRMHELKWRVCVENVDCGFHFSYLMGCAMQQEYGEWVSADAKTMPRSVAICALRALGVEVET